MGKPQVALMNQPDGQGRRRPRTVPTSVSWLSPKDSAKHLGVSINVIYDACASRGLRHVKLGHSTIRIRPEWLDAWAESYTQ